MSAVSWALVFEIPRGPFRGEMLGVVALRRRELVRCYSALDDGPLGAAAAVVLEEICGEPRTRVDLDLDDVLLRWVREVAATARKRRS